MKNVVYGCLCTLLLALTWAAIDLRTLIRSLDARTEQIATGAYLLTQTQNIYWRGADLQAARLLGSTRHSVEKMNALLDSTNDSLNNGERGLLPTLAYEIHKNGRASNQLLANADANLNGTDREPGLIPLSTKQVLDLSSKSQAAMDEATSVLHNTDRATLAAAQTMEAAGPQLVAISKNVAGVTFNLERISDAAFHKFTSKSRMDQLRGIMSVGVLGAKIAAAF